MRGNSAARRWRSARTVRVMLDLLTRQAATRFAARPMHLLGGCGVLLLLLGVLAALGGILLRACCGMAGLLLPLLQLGVISGLCGIQCILLGLVAEMVMRTYFAAQARPAYIVRRVIKGSKDNAQVGSIR